MKKTCIKCGEEKELKFFYKAKSYKDGHGGVCKICVAACGKKYRDENTEKIAARKKKYRDENTGKAAASRKKYYETNPEKAAASRKKYYETNHEKVNALAKKYYEANHEKVIVCKKKYYNNRRNTDPAFKLLRNLRSRLGNAIKGNTKSASTMKLIGCTIEKLQEHLENQFTDDMTWENYGEWHVDHILPCVSFDFTKDEEQFKCFHYANLQPLWAEDNLRKSSKIINQN